MNICTFYFFFKLSSSTLQFALLFTESQLQQAKRKVSLAFAGLLFSTECMLLVDSHLTEGLVQKNDLCACEVLSGVLINNHFNEVS